MPKGGLLNFGGQLTLRCPDKASAIPIKMGIILPLRGAFTGFPKW